ncbi:L-Ala-D/L-Glu epimerase [Klebsiella pneumoniae]|uniref:L-Ala-D/L-Glu epimerase n=1 Tax=Klebsiella pneumoniae TaxID=573 RepID=A0A377ZRN4_KLEPN|nr:L-Ala-D/L-Glu epimerase [Klebsiella pneumoniae]
MAQVMAIGEQLEAGLTREQLQRLLPAGAARNAIDCALWDLQARREGKTLAQLLGVALPDRVITAQTVVIGTPDQMAASAAALWQAGAQLLKVKLDDRLISERLIAIRQAAPEATLIVDANESWHSEGLAARCQLLADLGVAMLEQPLPADDDSALENFVHPLPICADESCHTRESLPRLRGRYEMVNIKLDKTGGLTEAAGSGRGGGNGRDLNGCWAVCFAPRAGSPPRSLWRRWRASLTSTARHGWRWTLSRRCGSAPACFIFKPASAADRSSPAGNAPLPRRRRPAGTRR